SETTIAQPPYVPVLDISAGWQGLKDFFAGLSIDNYARLFSDEIYISSYLRSIWIAIVSTTLLLVCAYPIAYAITRTPRRVQTILIMLVILPFLTASLIRIYAWVNILQPDGLLNSALLTLGIVREPLELLNSDTAIYIGVVYSYLPFMVLPIYATLD